MHAGGLAQMAQNSFPSNGLGIPTSGLASRRGGQNIKPLSFDAVKSTATDKDNSIPTPRTSRSHLLAGLRTAPKSAVASTFPASPTAANHSHQTSMGSRQNLSANMYANAPKTSMPRFAQQQQKPQQQQQQQQQMPQAYTQMGLQYTADQVLAPPEIQVTDQMQDQMDPHMYAQLIAANASLAQQQQRLQQQLIALQAAAAQMNIGGYATHQQHQLQQLQLQQQQYMLYQQQQELQQLQQQQQLRQLQQQQQQQQQAVITTMAGQGSIYSYYDPISGQQTLFVDNSSSQATSQYLEQAQLAQAFANMNMQQQQVSHAPRVQVSPPPENATPSGPRTRSPPRYESPVEPTPLPPPSANAFRRGHKKSSSLANVNPGLKVNGQDVPPSAGPKTASFPLTPAAASHGPGEARAGEHPVRQPRGPPSIDELRAAPTSKHPGSKNFVHQARRFAVNNLVRAGMERRKGTNSSTGSMSPVSEIAEEAEMPLTDNDSDSGRSGSGSLAGDIEPSPSSRSSARGSWGAIGSDRPSSRSKSRNSIESSGSATSPCDSDASFAGVFKKPQQVPEPESQRKAPRLVLTSAEKRRNNGFILA